MMVDDFKSSGYRIQLLAELVYCRRNKKDDLELELSELEEISEGEDAYDMLTAEDLYLMPVNHSVVKTKSADFAS